jgi:hypothetical protein
MRVADGRLFRTGKATISAELAGIFVRLGSAAESWRTRLEKLRTRRLFGRFFAASRERLREAAARLTCDASETWLGVRRLDAVSNADRNEPAVSRAHFASQSRGRRGSLIISRSERRERAGLGRSGPRRRDSPYCRCKLFSLTICCT